MWLKKYQICTTSHLKVKYQWMIIVSGNFSIPRYGRFPKSEQKLCKKRSRYQISTLSHVKVQIQNVSYLFLNLLDWMPKILIQIFLLFDLVNYLALFFFFLIFRSIKFHIDTGIFKNSKEKAELVRDFLMDSETFLDQGKSCTAGFCSFQSCYFPTQFYTIDF